MRLATKILSLSPWTVSREAPTAVVISASPGPASHRHHRKPCRHLAQRWLVGELAAAEFQGRATALSSSCSGASSARGSRRADRIASRSPPGPPPQLRVAGPVAQRTVYSIYSTVSALFRDAKLADKIRRSARLKRSLAVRFITTQFPLRDRPQ